MIFTSFPKTHVRGFLIYIHKRTEKLTYLFHAIFLDNPPKNFFQNGWTPLTYTFLERSWPKLSLDGVYYDVISKWRP